MVFCGLRLDFLKKQEVGVVCFGCKTTGRGAVLFGLPRLLHIGLIRVRQNIANELLSELPFRSLLRLGFDFCGVGLDFRLFEWLKGVGYAISVGRVRFVLRDFAS